MKEKRNIIIALCLTIVVFVIDIRTPVGYADWLLYFIPVFIAASSLRAVNIPLLALAGTVLIAAGYFLSPLAGEPVRAVLNRSIGIFVLWLLSFIIVRNKRAQEALDRSVLELEQRAAERTEDLRQANASLKAQNAARERAQEELKRLSHQNELILKSAGEGIFGIDLHGNYTFVNKTGAALLGYTPEELVGKHSHALIHHVKTDGTPYPEEECKTYGAFRDCTTRHVDDEMFVRKDGTRFPVEYTSVPLFENDRIAGAVVTFNDITERKQVEEMLKLTKFSVDRASVSIFLIGRDGRLLYCNDQASATLGYTREELLTLTVHDLDPDISPSGWQDLWTRLKKEGSGQIETAHRRKDGTLVPMQISANYVAFGSREYDWAFGLDISDRKRAEQELTKISRRHQLILESAGEGILGIDSLGRTVFINKAASAMLGYEPHELIGKKAHAQWHYAKPNGAPYPVEECPIYAAYKDGIIHSGEEAFIRKDGSSFPVDFKSIPLKEDSIVVGAVLTFRDITERKKMEEEIRHMAFHDALTGMPNRRLFLQIIAVEIAQAHRHRSKLAVLFLDLDRFKEINDTLGHDIGDLLLKEVARRIKGALRDSDTVARIGGDEFNLILSDIDQPEHAAAAARKILNQIQQPFTIGSNELNISTSIGISIYPDDSVDINTLLQFADIAMYHAKERGRNVYQFYNPRINIQSIERIQFESYLRQTLARNELVVHYQPQVVSKTRKIVSAEALVRWRHPEFGLLDSKQFIPVAESIGMITSIDEWVLKTACSQLKQWMNAGYDHLSVAVNLSARIFQAPEIVQIISGILEETGLPPDRLEIEITESAAMADIERTAALLKELAAKGIGIAIDDFGTGYSSLNYLKRLPIHRLKIDRSFVKDITTDPDDRSIIKAVTAMAHNMKMKVIAEGVETEEQLSFLSRIQCDEAQGFLVSESLPAEKFTELLAAAR